MRSINKNSETRKPLRSGPGFGGRIKPYYSDQYCTIFHTDFREVLPELGTVDVIISDPPYDLSTHSGGRFGASSEFGKLGFLPLENYDFISDLTRITRSWILLFCPLESLGRIRSENVENYVRGMVWDRKNPSPQLSGDRPAQAVEAIATLHTTRKNMRWNGHGKAGIYRYSQEFGQKEHPTQKPLRLMKALVADFSNKGEIILDPFMGSGSTLRAAKDLGRQAIGIEIEEKYCEIAARRLAQEVLPL